MRVSEIMLSETVIRQPVSASAHRYLVHAVDERHVIYDAGIRCDGVVINIPPDDLGLRSEFWTRANEIHPTSKE